jgi:ribosomal protein S12 methylthiotransferase
MSPNIGWLRLLYLYPSRISDELLDLMQNEPKVCKYIDLPLQHINDRILNLMHRQTRKQDILRLIDKIRKKIPHIAIRTSIIVGFPSETEKDFKELLDFILDVRFERLGAFIYSQEEGTQAYNFKNQIPDKIKEERFNTLMMQQQKISQGVNKEFLGEIIDVLIDEPSSCAQGLGEKEEDYYLGRSQYDAPEVDGLIYVDSKERLNPGDFVKVKITDTLEYDLVGETLENISNADLRKSNADIRR